MKESKNQVKEIQTNIGIYLPGNSPLYTQFVKPAKENRQLAPFVKKMLEAYFYDKELRDHMDSVISYNDVPQQAKRRIDEVISGLENSVVTAKVLHGILSSNEIDSYDDISLDKNNPFETTGIIEHMLNLLPTESKENAGLFIEKKFNALEEQVKTIQKKIENTPKNNFEEASYNEYKQTDNSSNIKTIYNNKDKFNTIDTKLNDTPDSSITAKDDYEQSNIKHIKNNKEKVIEDVENIDSEENFKNFEPIIKSDNNISSQNKNNEDNIIYEDDDEDVVIEDDEDYVVIEDGVENDYPDEDNNKYDDIGKTSSEEALPIGFGKMCDSLNITEY